MRPVGIHATAVSMTPPHLSCGRLTAAVMSPTPTNTTTTPKNSNYTAAIKINKTPHHHFLRPAAQTRASTLGANGVRQSKGRQIEEPSSLMPPPPHLPLVPAFYTPSTTLCFCVASMCFFFPLLFIFNTFAVINVS